MINMAELKRKDPLKVILYHRSNDSWVLWLPFKLLLTVFKSSGSSSDGNKNRWRSMGSNQDQVMKEKSYLMLSSVLKRPYKVISKFSFLFPLNIVKRWMSCGQSHHYNWNNVTLAVKYFVHEIVCIFNLKKTKTLTCKIDQQNIHNSSNTGTMTLTKLLKLMSDWKHWRHLLNKCHNKEQTNRYIWLFSRSQST